MDELVVPPEEQAENTKSFNLRLEEDGVSLLYVANINDKTPDSDFTVPRQRRLPRILFE